MIDVFFVQVRPSPWRQAVDLANMMLVLALRSDAQTVYEKALGTSPRGALGGVRRDTWCGEPDAAPQLHEAGRTRPARGVPGGWHPRVRASGSSDGAPASRTDTPHVAPRHRCGRLQHLAVLPEPGQRRDPGVRNQPNDDPDGPGGAIGHTPAVYPVASFGLEHLCRDDRARPRELRTHSNSGEGGPGSFQLQLGPTSAEVGVTLARTCPPAGGESGSTILRVDGGCVTYRSSLPAGLDPVPSFDPDGGLSFVPRSQLVTFIEKDEDLILCGAGAQCP